jgi:dissimilatory sulfite reductase related protein
MTTMQVAGSDLNRKGFLAHFDDWDGDRALTFAAAEGLTLTAHHWSVIRFLRDYYTTHEMPPSPRVVAKAIGMEISPHVPFTRRHLEALFPNGGCEQACRIAGLPDYFCHGC